MQAGSSKGGDCCQTERPENVALGALFFRTQAGSRWLFQRGAIVQVDRRDTECGRDTPLNAAG